MQWTWRRSSGMFQDAFRGPTPRWIGVKGRGEGGWRGGLKVRKALILERIVALLFCWAGALLGGRVVLQFLFVARGGVLLGRGRGWGVGDCLLRSCPNCTDPLLLAFARCEVVPGVRSAWAGVASSIGARCSRRPTVPKTILNEDCRSAIPQGVNQSAVPKTNLVRSPSCSRVKLGVGVGWGGGGGGGGGWVGGWGGGAPPIRQRACFAE